MGWIRIDKQDGTETPETDAVVHSRLKGYYSSVALAIKMAREGHDIQTSFAFYRWTDTPEQP